jgi:serine/threonine protein kinase/DNA-binding SARP family transcriptional activator/pimeloyl-ACP methyl ester carboxylesterase
VWKGYLMERLKLYVFGPPRIEHDGRPVELNLRKALALLAYLAVTGQPQSRDALATLLWPEGDQSEGRARLRRTLHRLTQDVGDDILDAGPDTIQLRHDADVWLDSRAFRQHVLAGLPAQPADALAPERVAHLVDAVTLHADDFLAGFSLPDSPAFDEWQFFTRESLRQLYGQVLEQVVSAYRSQSAWDTAIPYARRWVALDELHEPAHRTLMRLYAWAGQHSAALRQFQECVRVLDAELGATPEPETVALYEAIRTRQLHTPPPAPPDDPAVQPRYDLGELFAAGGQGEVFRGYDRQTGQPVAIKRLKLDLVARHPDMLARFVREGEILRQLQHPNIVGILDTFEQSGHYAIVMEFMPGGSLRELLSTGGRLPLDRVLALGLELADALSRAHHLGIVHRDLKPENVLLAADGTPRLTDFGMARFTHDQATLTQGGATIGSPAYMSPEAVRGAELDGRSDIWSLGVLLYELLTGRRPFDGSQVTPMLANILEATPAAIEPLRPDIPAALSALLQRMLAKERAERVRSMREVAAALEAIRDGRVVPASAAEVGAPPHASPSPTAETQASQSSSAAWAQAGSPLPTPLANRRRAQDIRFARTSDHVQIAYATIGEGPPLVKAANWLSHLEFDWQSPVWRHWLAGLSEHHTLVRYDERGCGLSDWAVEDFSVEAWVGDLETVVDKLGLERFPLLGISQGGPVAITYAVRHPERVSHLIIYGSYGRGWSKRPINAEQREEAELQLAMTRIGWGRANPMYRQVFASMFIPGATAEQVRWFSDLQRISTSPENAVKFIEAFYSIDVNELATQVTTPTLVLHGREDQRIPFEFGRELAALIPGARFVPLESSNHILLEDEPAWRRFLAEIERFLDTPGG